ncbi:hypothetical protein [Sediminicurvatus halobius]|uniref:Uncharacterized protein n=1 Tax=Sediminicurvatus halobius TaxID=2182432 RepID=A0A2U2N0A3_9GAMM|nr:hypothetical protein [Spiribacter halobius]PWG62487.1 hypothetical protein DEM34_11935 [Spiribacter halobius]UEX78579.1 hypothetical protein LMH63_02735 [Spiribacter halobius]
MSYRIAASLHRGNPRLEVVDAHSGRLRLAWEYPKARRRHAGDGADAAVEELFRRLFLLTTEDYLRGDMPPRQRD